MIVLIDRNPMVKDERNKIFAAVYLLLVKEDKVAMIRRYNTGYQDGNFTLPSGHIDADESAITAIIREGKEEVGVTIKPQSLTLAHLIHRNSPNRVYVDLYFLATEWDGEPVLNEPDKSDQLEWFQFDKLPQNIIVDVKFAIEGYRSGKLYSEFGW